MTDLISVIIPFYNSEEFLAKSIESVLKQQDVLVELILVNDASTDNSLKIAESFQKFTNVKLLSNPKRGGAASARKLGEKHASGNYIMLLDSDDYLDSNYLKIMLDQIKKEKANICCSRMAVHYNLPLIKQVPIYSRKSFKETISLVDEKENLPFVGVCGTAKLYRREFFPLQNDRFMANEDLSVNYYYYAFADIMTFQDTSFYHYLFRPNGTVATEIVNTSYEKLLNTVLPLEYLKKTFVEEGKYLDYECEVEFIFIQNIMQRLNNVLTSAIRIEKKKQLITALISYLGSIYPNWRDNKILNTNNYLEINNKIEVMVGKKIVSHLSIPSLTRDQSLEAYQKVMNH